MNRNSMPKGTRLPMRIKTPVRSSIEFVGKLVLLWLALRNTHALIAQEASDTNAAAENVTVAPIAANDTTTVVSRGELIVVQGAGGRDEYTQAFAKSATAWQSLAQAANLRYLPIGPTIATVSDHDQLKMLLAQFADGSEQDPPSSAQTPIYLVLLGHGTYNQGTAKFNLQGPDLTSDELAAWLEKVKRPVALINCSSASAPFLEKLSSHQRVVISATRAGTEQNATRFGEYMAAAIADAATDLDHDGAVSLLEAFLRASHDTQQFYADASRLATEHALLDDNGDKAGTTADFFQGIRAVRQTNDGRAVDGFRAHQWLLRTFSADAPLSESQIARRTELETRLEALRQQKGQLGEDAYYAQIEALLIELARLYEGE